MALKKIAVLTSGGDAPGMNAAIRAVVRMASHRGIDVVGVKRGYNGLINGDIIDLKTNDVSDIVHRGGTILFTARCSEFRTEEGQDKAVAMCKKLGIDGVVVIGGDGSFRGAADLSAKGIPCVGIPATIDNDIACTEYTIGYDTAMNTVVEMVDKIRDTSQSHDRCSVVEVMGRHAGYIALNCGIACGATYVMVPEIKQTTDNIIEKIISSKEQGKKHFIIMVAEGVGNVSEMAHQIEEKTGIETRATTLGHVQRGGGPSTRDRVCASRFGDYAVTLLSQGIGNRVLGMRKDEIVDYDIQEALEMKKPFPTRLYAMAYELSI